MNTENKQEEEGDKVLATKKAIEQRTKKQRRRDTIILGVVGGTLIVGGIAVSTTIAVLGITLGSAAVVGLTAGTGGAFLGAALIAIGVACLIALLVINWDRIKEWRIDNLSRKPKDMLDAFRKPTTSFNRKIAITKRYMSDKELFRTNAIGNDEKREKEFNSQIKIFDKYEAYINAKRRMVNSANESGNNFKVNFKQYLKAHEELSLADANVKVPLPKVPLYSRYRFTGKAKIWVNDFCNETLSKEIQKKENNFPDEKVRMIAALRRQFRLPLVNTNDPFIYQMHVKAYLSERELALYYSHYPEKRKEKKSVHTSGTELGGPTKSKNILRDSSFVHEVGERSSVTSTGEREAHPFFDKSLRKSTQQKRRSVSGNFDDVEMESMSKKKKSGGGARE